jgi:hypothetical protein
MNSFGKAKLSNSADNLITKNPAKTSTKGK